MACCDICRQVLNVISFILGIIVIVTSIMFKGKVLHVREEEMKKQVKAHCNATEETNQRFCNTYNKELTTSSNLTTAGGVIQMIAAAAVFALTIVFKDRFWWIRLIWIGLHVLVLIMLAAAAGLFGNGAMVVKDIYLQCLEQKRIYDYYMYDPKDIPPAAQECLVFKETVAIFGDGLTELKQAAITYGFVLLDLLFILIATIIVACSFCCCKPNQTHSGTAPVHGDPPSQHAHSPQNHLAPGQTTTTGQKLTPEQKSLGSVKSSTSTKPSQTSMKKPAAHKPTAGQISGVAKRTSISSKKSQISAKKPTSVHKLK